MINKGASEEVHQIENEQQQDVEEKGKIESELDTILLILVHGM
jgi:hypothetical protein